MRGTKLWQAAGSPLIQGRSRYERPFGPDLLSALAVGLLAGVLADAAMPWPAHPLAALAGAVHRTGPQIVIGVAIASAAAVSLSRVARAGRPWVVGAAAGSVVALGIVWWSGGLVR